MQEPGLKKLTMDDVARELGVSKTTVSRSVSGKGRIGKETRERVLSYIAAHSHKQPDAAKGQESGTAAAAAKPVAGSRKSWQEQAGRQQAEQAESGSRQAEQDEAGSRAAGQTAAARHSSVRNSSARKKAGNRGTCNIGVVLPADLFSQDRPYFPKVLKGISEVADSEDYDVIMILIDTNDLSRLSRVIEKHKVDGLILIRTSGDEKPVEMLKNSGIPFAAAGMSEDTQIYQADNDYAEACYELTSILLMKGIKKIAAVAGNMNYLMNQKRMEGFYKAHRERGAVPDKSLVFTDINSALSAAKAADTILMRGAGCILCGDDLLASYVLRELEEKNIRIPQDMRLACFHDSQLLASAKTGITAIAFHTEELGREACRMLLHQLRGEEVPRVAKLPYEVTLRESTK